MSTNYSYTVVNSTHSSWLKRRLDNLLADSSNISPNILDKMSKMINKCMRDGVIQGDCYYCLSTAIGEAVNIGKTVQYAALINAFPDIPKLGTNYKFVELPCTSLSQLSTNNWLTEISDRSSIFFWLPEQKCGVLLIEQAQLTDWYGGSTTNGTQIMSSKPITVEILDELEKTIISKK